MENCATIRPPPGWPGNVGPPGGRNGQGRLRALHIGGLTADQRQNDSRATGRIWLFLRTGINSHLHRHPRRRRSLLFCPSLTVIRTGMRWAILTKLPVALSAEMALNSHPGRRGDTLHLAVEGLAVERLQ